MSNFDQPVRDFLAYLKVEARLSPATLSAYADLDSMLCFLDGRE